MEMEGKQLGRYRILHLLGSGGMGDVYLAEDPHIQQQVAIKVIRSEVTPYAESTHPAHEAARIFHREVRAIVKLDHPHILPLYDYGEAAIGELTLHYLVMPYRPDGSLAKWVQTQFKETLLASSDVAHLIKQAADALQHAHSRQIIHQDVKPSNFLLRHRSEAPRRPDIFLADFGIARLMTATSSISQSARGTPTYMAPEQYTGGAEPATDQYALAVMAYELLTGRPPFQGNPVRMMYLHLNQPPAPPSTLNPHLSPEVDVALLYALAKNPGERFASIAAFANAFQQSIAHLEQPDALMPLPIVAHPALSATPGGITSALTLPNDQATPSAVFPLDAAPTRITPVPVSGSALPARPVSVPGIEDAPTKISGPQLEATALAPAPPSPGGLVASSSTSSTFSSTGATGPAAVVAVGDMPGSARAPLVPAIPGSMPIVPPAPPAGVGPLAALPGGSRRPRRKWLLAIAAAVLALALVSGGMAYALTGSSRHIVINPLPSLTPGHSSPTPGSSNTSVPTSDPSPNPSVSPSPTGTPQPIGYATVTITPANQLVSNTFIISTQARQISATTQTYQTTVPTTGQSTTQGTQATGFIDIDGILSSPVTVPVGNAYFNTAGNGGPAIHLVFDQAVTFPGDGQYHLYGSIAGHVQEYGTIGNFSGKNAFQYNFPGINLHLYNDGPYSGGQNGQTVTVVQQSDVDGAKSSLISADQPTTQQATQLLQGQVQSNERQIGTPQCSANSPTSNPVVGVQATQVTVSLNFTCTGSAYDYTGVQNQAAQQLTNQAASNPGVPPYALTGSIKTAVITDVINGSTVTATVSAQGVWVYQFNSGRLQSLALLIAGENVQAAQNTLGSQPGVAQVNSIVVSGGNGLPLPSDPTHITIVVLTVPGA